MAFENVEDRGKEPIIDSETFRKTMEGFWRREVSIQEVKKQLAIQDAMHQNDLLRAGYEMEAYLQATRKPESSEPHDFKELIIASTNKSKREIIGEVAAEEKVLIKEVPLDDISSEEEEKSHRQLHKLIQERKDYEEGGVHMEPTFRYFTPTLYALDVAEEKMRKVAENQGKESAPILACGVVVLEGKRILEKPKNKEEAASMLKSLSGKTVEISFGITLLAPTAMGRIVLKEAARSKIHLRPFTENEIAEYFDKIGEDYLNIAGAIDYSSPAAKIFLDQTTPVSIEKIEDLHFGSSRGSVSVLFSPEILEKAKGYVAGVPRELIKAMIGEGRTLSA